MSIKSDLVDEIFEREWGKHEYRKKYFTVDNCDMLKDGVFHESDEIRNREDAKKLQKEIGKVRDELKDLALEEVSQNPILISDIVAILPCYEYHQVAHGVFVTRLPTGFKFDNENGSVFIKEEDFIKHTSLK